MTPQETIAACGFYLQPGHFSSRILNTDSSDAKLFINCVPNFFLTLDGQLLQIPRGAQSDGISAPQIAAALGREHGGDDWIAGWYHDGGYRGWLLKWEAVVEPADVKDWIGGRWVKARLSETETDSLLHDCALACGDTDAMADALLFFVTQFGHRFFNPVY